MNRFMNPGGAGGGASGPVLREDYTTVNVDGATETIALHATAAAGDLAIITGAVNYGPAQPVITGGTLIRKGANQAHCYLLGKILTGADISNGTLLFTTPSARGPAICNLFTGVSEIAVANTISAQVSTGVAVAMPAPATTSSLLLFAWGSLSSPYQTGNTGDDLALAGTHISSGGNISGVSLFWAYNTTGSAFSDQVPTESGSYGFGVAAELTIA